MNRKEISEIRRRFRPERNGITHIYGCYVNSNREIISYIDESVALMSAEENDKYMKLLRKVLSGTAGKNLVDVSFATKQVMDSDEHRLLSSLRKCELKDEQLRNDFYKNIIEVLDMDGENYIILMAFDSYDVPAYGKDGETADSTQVFKYLVCGICPVKTGKAELGYFPEEKRFHHLSEGHIVAPPALGFMFPAFDERCANIYSALFYSKSSNDIHQDFIDAVFRIQPPLPAGQQRELFSSALAQSLDKGCTYQVVQSVHEQLKECIAVHKESKDPETLTLSQDEMEDILENSGADEEQLESFREICKRDFGEDAQLNPSNIINSKRMEIVTPEYKITVEPQFSHLVQMKKIEGRSYILLPADSGVELNGIGLTIE